MSDIVTALMDLAREQLRSADPRELEEWERVARLRHGGERCRVSERPRQQITLAQIDDRLRERKSVREVANEFGVHRRTIYRLLRRRKATPRPAVSAPA